MADEKKYNYYKEQLKKLKKDPVFPMQMKIKSQEGETHWMELNPNSIKVVLIYLVDQLRELYD